MHTSPDVQRSASLLRVSASQKSLPASALRSRGIACVSGSSFWHACTPARSMLRIAGLVSVGLHSYAQLLQLHLTPHALRFALPGLGHALTSAPSLHAFGSSASRLDSSSQAPGSLLLDLKIFTLHSSLLALCSPNAKRPTVRLIPALVAPIHNLSALLLAPSLTPQQYELALQAVPQLINNKRLKRDGLTDCLTSNLSRPTGLLDPFNGMSCLSMPYDMPTIHNYQLSIALIQQYTDTVALLSHRCLALLPHQCDKIPNHAQMSQKRVKTEKWTPPFFRFSTTKEQGHAGCSLSRRVPSQGALTSCVPVWHTLPPCTALLSLNSSTVSMSSGTEVVNRTALDACMALRGLHCSDLARKAVPGRKDLQPSSLAPAATQACLHFVTLPGVVPGSLFPYSSGKPAGSSSCPTFESEVQYV
jgi:hypothetical protein